MVILLAGWSFQHHLQHIWYHENETSPSSRQGALPSATLCAGAACSDTAVHPGSCHSNAGGRGRQKHTLQLATFSSYWIIPSSKQIQAHRTVCSWAPLSVQRKPISQKSCLQHSTVLVFFSLVTLAILGLLFFLPLQRLFCSNAQHLRVAKIFGANQPGHQQVVLPIFQRCRAFVFLSALTTLQVYPVHFHCVFDTVYFICLILQSIIQALK